MSNYAELLATVAANRNWGEEEVNRFNEWKEQVAEIESNNIVDRKQKKGGPARGKFQYELKKGKGSGANITAVNRLKRMLGNNLSSIPEADRKILESEDPDFSLLSEDTQDSLFLADKVFSPKAPLNDLVQGKIDPATAWAEWHWKGDSKEKPAKIAMFNERMDQLKLRGIQQQELEEQGVMQVAGGAEPIPFTQELPPETDEIAQAIEPLTRKNRGVLQALAKYFNG